MVDLGQKKVSESLPFFILPQIQRGGEQIIICKTAIMFLRAVSNLPEAKVYIFPPAAGRFILHQIQRGGEQLFFQYLLNAKVK